MKKKILVLTDNFIMYQRVVKLLHEEYKDLVDLFDFKRSKLSKIQKLYACGIEALDEINVKTDYIAIIEGYEKVISLHCKQIFPPELIAKIHCINIHPGYNPYNRGWYPQIFAIVNNTVFGATIHVMDNEIDHGAIIARKKIKIESYDTSKEAYEKALDAEIELLRENLESIINNTYKTFCPEIEGGYNSVGDFRNLCEINLNEQLTFGDAINKLRALSHGSYKNAFFYDQNGDKVFVKIELNRDDSK